MEQPRKRLWKKWWVYALAVALLMAITGGVLLTGIVVNAARLDDPAPADVMIVLGAAIDPTGFPMPNLQRRLDRALGLYREGYAPAIIVTGAQGHDEPMTEAVAMKAYLVERGVPEASVFLEDDSFNTRQNLEYARAIMEAEGFETALVVSSEYHLWRALSLCGDLSIEASGAGALGALTWPQVVKNWLRETASWVKYLAQRWI